MALWRWLESHHFQMPLAPEMVKSLLPVLMLIGRLSLKYRGQEPPLAFVKLLSMVSAQSLGRVLNNATECVMEQAMLWVTIFGIIILPMVGVILKDAIFKKIDEISKKQDEDRVLFFKKYDEQKEIFVRKDMYEQAQRFIKDESDAKFNHILEKIEDLKMLIIKNFNDHKSL